MACQTADSGLLLGKFCARSRALRYARGILEGSVIGSNAVIAALREGRPVSRFLRLDPRIRENSLRGLWEFLYLYKFQ